MTTHTCTQTFPLPGRTQLTLVHVDLCSMRVLLSTLHGTHMTTHTCTQTFPPPGRTQLTLVHVDFCGMHVSSSTPASDRAADFLVQEKMKGLMYEK